MNLPAVKYDIFELSGGLDQKTPTLSLKPGVCRRATNFECSITGGYTRIPGYERYDGHARPSDATYTKLTCTFSGVIAVGNTVTGMVSSATGKVIAVTANAVIVTRVTGAFAAPEGLSVTTQKAIATDASNIDGDVALDATYKALAADEYRTSISAVPGTGSILGVCDYNSKRYAWRNNALGTAVDMYVSSSSGWTKIVFGEEISFSNANTSVAEGDVLTQGGVTATIARMVVATGTLVSGTNTGRLILTGRAGGNFAAGAATSTGAGALTLSGAQAQIVLAPGGRYRAVVANFGAGQANQRMYVANGVTRAFEFDGTNIVPISTGMTDDTPDLIAVHKQHLFLTFGYSLQFSGTGLPFAWSPILGAGELGMDGDITNLVILPGDQTSGALGVFTRITTSILYGTDPTTFILSAFNTGSGAVYDTGQNLDQTYFLNEQGVVSIATTKNYGNFLPSALTMNLRPFIQAHLPVAIASGLNREKGQFRLFFSDGYALYTTIRSGKFMGAMPIQYTNPVTCVCEGDSANGKKTSYFGSTNGMVYEMDTGSSFDGVSIPYNFTLIFNGEGNHRILKRYRKAAVEITGDSYATFGVGYDLGYRSAAITQAEDANYSNDLRSSYWDDFTWDNFVWDGRDISPNEIEVTGTAENVAFRVAGFSSIIPQFTINSFTVHYTPRRGLR